MFFRLIFFCFNLALTKTNLNIKVISSSQYHNKLLIKYDVLIFRFQRAAIFVLMFLSLSVAILLVASACLLGRHLNLKFYS